MFIDAEQIVEHWYGEHSKYEYETPGWQMGTNYFTQIIWKATEEVSKNINPHLISIDISS